MLKCPRDQSTLEEKVYEADVRVDCCPTCKGTWLDRGELERIQATIEHDYSEALAGVVDRFYKLAQEKERPPGPCPHCRVPLAQKPHPYCSRVLIDLCAKCGGIWLDSGELQILEQTFELAQQEIESERKGWWASLTGLFPLYRIGTIKARFVRKADGQPLPGTSGQYSVKLYDKDPVQDDELGQPRLDADGRVQCTFDLYDVAGGDSPLERKPDLYLIVYERGHELFRTPVFWNLDFTPEKAGTQVTHDLGTFEVG